MEPRHETNKAPLLRGFFLALSFVLDVGGVYCAFEGLRRLWGAMDGMYLIPSAVALGIAPLVLGVACIVLARGVLPRLGTPREASLPHAIRAWLQPLRRFAAIIMGLVVIGFVAGVALPEGIRVGPPLTTAKAVVNRSLNGIVAYVPSEWLADKLAPEEGALFRAIEQDSVAQVRTAIARGHLVNEPRYDGFAPLHAAARHSTPQVVAVLLDSGADIDLGVWGRWAAGRTPLMAAAMSPSPGKVQLLLDRGAKADLRDTNGWTAIDYALHEKNAGALAILCKRGAPPREKCPPDAWPSAPASSAPSRRNHLPALPPSAARRPPSPRLS